MTLDELNNGATSLEICPVEYISESIRAITTPDGLSNFSYSLIKNIFSWKKKVEGVPFELFYGKISMTENVNVRSVVMCCSLVDNFLLH